jgi:60 kDa SS-A/Ro ribonucleoprotein
MTLEAACRYTAGLPFGGTDCALPMLDAAAKNIPADVFMVVSDNETWAGSVHPTIALQKYREATGINSKLIVMGVVSNEFSIADPNDSGMIDIVGFDSAVPSIISNFIAPEVAGHGTIAGDEL